MISLPFPQIPALMTTPPFSLTRHATAIRICLVTWDITYAGHTLFSPLERNDVTPITLTQAFLLLSLPFRVRVRVRAPPFEDPIPSTQPPAPPRCHPLPHPDPVPPVQPSRIPVAQHWYYEPVAPAASLPEAQAYDPELQAEVLAFAQHLSSSAVSSSALRPRQSWMLADDDHTDAQADLDWHGANERLFGVTPPLLPPVSSKSVSLTSAMVSDLLATTSGSPFPRFDCSSAYLPSGLDHSATSFPRPHPVHLKAKVIRRMFAARETIFKYGVYLTRNDRDADASSERVRWQSGRQLEWLWLKAVGAFEYDWTKDRLSREYPQYLHSDIGHLFYIYDYKFSGEHRVRLVFDGSRQSATTYDNTYSPTVRPESIRLFHVFSVEMGWHIRQYDVP
jgi:hypothetical protein